MNKYFFPGNSIYNQGSGKDLQTTIFYYGLVVSNIDELGANRIKVRITGIDAGITNDDDLSYSFPMIQKFVHIIPKIDEIVMVFIPDVNNPQIDRMYLGPIISQPQMMFRDNELHHSKSTLDSGIKKALPSPNTIPENKGVYPNTEDIAIQGRVNSDLIFKEKEVIVRAGQFESNTIEGDIPKFNKVNPSYVQIKHDVIINQPTDKIEPELGGVINVVTNKINLLTHKNGSPRFSLNDQESTISDEELQKIITEAHPLVFGDTLVEYLKLQRAAFSNHAHPYPGAKQKPLADTNAVEKYLKFNLDSILSKNIRIN